MAGIVRDRTSDASARARVDECRGPANGASGDGCGPAPTGSPADRARPGIVDQRADPSSRVRARGGVDPCQQPNFPSPKPPTSGPDSAYLGEEFVRGSERRGAPPYAGQGNTAGPNT